MRDRGKVMRAVERRCGYDRPRAIKQSTESTSALEHTDVMGTAATALGIKNTTTAEKHARQCD